MILERILEAKRREVATARRRCSEADLTQRPLWNDARRGFAAAIRNAPGRCIIAEIKKASPSRGTIRKDFDPARHAADYEAAGATCISVLTDGPFFSGSLEHLAAARGACRLPLLRKDFLIDPYQVAEARAAGADAVLLIVAALGRDRLDELTSAAAEAGLDVLTEVHDEAELDVACAAGANLIGINNRNLKTFETSLDVTRRLLARVPDGVTVISESGLHDAADLADLERLGVGGFLIGEAFMAAPSPGEKLASLLQP
jgi:indole-3-glycerol phosphate synthase